MAAPTCPALAFAGAVTTAAALTLTLGLDALYTSLTATVNDQGVAIAAANQPQVTKGGAPTDYIVIEPSASSAVTGKWVIVIAGAAAVAPGVAAMLSPDGAAVAQLYIGIYMANSGATVSRANFTAAWSTNATAGGFTGGTGTFSGYTKFYGAITTIAYMSAFMSAEDIVFQVQTITGTQYMAEAGLGIRGVSTDAVDSESGLLGRVFTLCTTGAGGPIVAAWMQQAWTSTTSNGPLGNYTTNDGAPHTYYRIPGATTSSSTSTMRQMTWYGNKDNGANGLGSSTAPQYIAASGAVEPDYVGMRDSGTPSTARDGIKVGRHRAMFFGPRKRSRYTLSTGGVAKWISAGSSSTASDANDCVLLPM